MIITTSYYNQASVGEKSIVRGLASIYKDADINIFDVYAYFFARNNPMAFDGFTRAIRKMLRSFGLSVDRMYLITYQCLPSIQEMQEYIERCTFGDRDMESVLLTMMFVPYPDIEKPDFDIDKYHIHIPKYIKDRFKSVDKSFFATTTKEFKMYRVLGQMSRLYKYNVVDYRVQKMEFLNVKGVLIQQTLYRFATRRSV